MWMREGCGFGLTEGWADGRMDMQEKKKCIWGWVGKGNHHHHHNGAMGQSTCLSWLVSLAVFIEVQPRSFMLSR
jgi:hypothetical protein